MELLTEITAFHWIALGLILLGAEALGAAGFLLGAAVAAFANAVVVWLVPDLSLGMQLGVFAIGALVATFVYFQLFRDAQQQDGTPPINQRAASLIGQRLTLTEAIEHEGRIQIGDTFWKVTAEEPLATGSSVVVISANDMTLNLRKT